ncbi:MAG: stage V sporulation protein AE [Bacillota bacterium]
MKKRVILVTDGDENAQEAIIQACKNEGLYPMLSSGGNPTPLTGERLAWEIKQAPYDPVVVMLDDRGKVGEGSGEKALEHLLLDESLDVLGVIAVASNTDRARGVEVSKSVDRYGHVVKQPVDKYGEPEPVGHHLLEGDTSEILARFPWVKVVGVGDLGKMKGRDDPAHGAMITTRCIKELLGK